MLVELRVRDLGVIEDLVVTPGRGMTALTGETGAGKTLVVEAVELLMGGRADPSLVRHGATTALVEGRFVTEQVDGGNGREVVLQREVPRDGRSRAYVDGRMATASQLAELGRELVDLHGQHSHQSLLHVAAQRQALDHYASAPLEEVTAAGAALQAVEDRLASAGGDPQVLARELDLLRFQLAELDAAAVVTADEDETLARSESLLAAANDLRRAVADARDLLVGDDGARDLVARATEALGDHDVLSDLAARLAAAGAELEECARELRARGEGFEDDPERLAAVQERRRLLSELRRKYGPELADVVAYHAQARHRLGELETSEERRAELARERDEAREVLSEEEAKLGRIRRAAAPRLAGEIEQNLRRLALAGARIEVIVGEDARGDEVEFRLGANEGEPTLPLARVASGGELARAMLATRLVLSEAPPTLVFDEVDAGIGGEAALHVGRALGELGGTHQVLVVTHLAQVAAFASTQIAVAKRTAAGRTLTTAREVTGEDRLAELSRMLSGQPGSDAARRHARELLESAVATR